MNDDDIRRVNHGHLASQIDAVLEDSLDKLHSQIDARMYKALNDGEVSPNFALQCWMEKHAIQRFQLWLRQKVRDGRSVSLTE